MKRTALLIIMMVFMLAGCGTTSNLCTVPESEGSKICALSESMNMDPALISQGLLAINFIALKNSVYTPQQAIDFVSDLEVELVDLRAQGQIWTLEQAINYIDAKLDVLPDDVKLAFMVFDTDGLSQMEIKQPITDYDFELVLRHLAKQRTLIRIYL